VIQGQLAVVDLGRTVFLISSHVLDARHIEETFSHEQDHRFAARKPHEEPCKAACVGGLLDVGGWRCARMLVRSHLSRSRF
jgi:hypothetical protein